MTSSSSSSSLQLESPSFRSFADAPACPRPQYTVIRPEYNAKALEHATEDEKKKLAELQDRIAEDYPTEREDVFWLMKFLRAKQCDVDKAEALFRARMKFIEEEKPHLIDPSKEPDVAEELKQVRCFLYGRDKDGRPIVNIRSGLDFATRPSQASRRAILYVVEKTMQEMPPPPHDQYCIILNRRNSQMMRPRDTTMSKTGHFYPETLRYMWFINASWTFNLMLKFVALFVDQKTRDKFLALSDPSELLKYVDKEQLLPDILAQCKGISEEEIKNHKKLPYWPPWAPESRIFAHVTMAQEVDKKTADSMRRMSDAEVKALMDKEDENDDEASDNPSLD